MSWWFRTLTAVPVKEKTVAGKGDSDGRSGNASDFSRPYTRPRPFLDQLLDLSPHPDQSPRSGNCRIRVMERTGDVDA